MAAIGILGGMGPQASAHLQNLLVRDVPKHIAVQSDADFPEIILLSVPVPNFVENKKHLEQAKQILLSRLKLFEQGNSVINGIACNTAHLLLPDLAAATSIPFVSIPQLVAARVAQQKFRRVGLLATPNTLQSALYDDALSRQVTLVRPSNTVAASVEKLIFKELQGTRTDHDRQQLHTLVQTFRTQEQLDAVILGCTELPLVFGPATDDHIIDTLQILSDGLLAAFAATQNGRKIQQAYETLPVFTLNAQGTV
jgi:aspartate racemase